METASPQSMSPEFLFLSYNGKPLPQLARILSEPYLMCFVVLPRRYSPNGRRRPPIFKGFPRKLWRRMLLRVAVFQTYAFNFSESEYRAYVSKLEQLYTQVIPEANLRFSAPAGFNRGSPIAIHASYVD